jgi:adenylosuccinate synthase
MRDALRVGDSKFFLEQLEMRGVATVGPDYDPLSVYQHTIVEGTQGFGLGLHAGYYPNCTSSDCRASDFLAMAGISPWQADDIKVHVVARIYPIRIAGNSGPLMNEVSWEQLGLPEEFTTVTKKVRRVGMPDWPLVERAVRANGGAPVVRVALTMLDQLMPAIADKMVLAEDCGEEPFRQAVEVIREIQHEVGAPIEWVTTGPNTATNIRALEI